MASSLASQLEVLAITEGTVSRLSTGPEALVIGTAKAFQKGYEYHYRKGRVGEEYMYQCAKGSDYSMAGEVLYIVCEGEYYVAHDGWTNHENRLTLRQPVFRTRDDFYMVGTHHWEINHAAHASSVRATPDWRGHMATETRLT